MLLWETSYLRKIRAVELKADDAVPVFDGGNLFNDRIKTTETIPSLEDRVYSLSVADDHTLVANGIFTGQCDGDEDCIMLLLDGLLNFYSVVLTRIPWGFYGCTPCINKSN